MAVYTVEANSTELEVREIEATSIQDAEEKFFDGEGTVVYQTFQDQNIESITKGKSNYKEME